MSTAPVTTSSPTDHWSDAQRAARSELGEDALGPARRGYRLRRAGAVGAQLAFVVAVLAGSYAFFDPRTDDLSERWGTFPGGFAILCLGVVVQLVASVRQSGMTADLPSTPADALLPADDRRWVRDQITAVAPVPEERRAVVVDRARRLEASRTQVLQMIGFVLIMLGLVATSPSRGIVCAGALITAYAAASAIRDLVRARRARRWLALDAEPAR